MQKKYKIQGTITGRWCSSKQNIKIMKKRRLIIKKLRKNTWRVKGKGIEILTNTEEKAKEWKRYYAK